MSSLHSSTASTLKSAALRSFEAQWLARDVDSLSPLREKAMQRFLRLGLPTPRDESWRAKSLSFAACTVRMKKPQRRPPHASR